jgi:hypothetical protein
MKNQIVQKRKKTEQKTIERDPWRSQNVFLQELRNVLNMENIVVSLNARYLLSLSHKESICKSTL